MKQWLHGFLGHWPFWTYYDRVGGVAHQRLCTVCRRRQRLWVEYDQLSGAELARWWTG